VTVTDLWAPATTAEGIIDRANQFFASQALLTGNRLGIFSRLGADGRKEAAELAKELDAEPRALGFLLDALAGLGYLAKDQRNRFANSPVAKRHLVPGGEGPYLGDYLHFQDLLWEPWQRLEQAVKTGKPTRPADMFQKDKDEARRFIRAMRATASLNAPFLAARLDLAGRERLLDLGGGPGTFALHFCKANPALRATVFDLPATIEVARQLLDEDPDPAKERVELKVGDFNRDALGGPYDVVFLSHVIHGHLDLYIRALLMRTRDALKGGGLLVLHDFFTERSHTTPAFASLFGLNMLVSTDGGRTWSFEELKAELERLGYRDVEWRRLGQPRGLSLVVAVSPAQTAALRPK
jgi:SAM-dependent methyltransferase